MSLKRAGFTLIELLVVIAIIAILAAILRPSFSAVKEQTSMAVCQAHLEQIHLALSQFAADHGRMPASLEELIEQRYLLDKEIIHCSKTNKLFYYHPVALEASGDAIIAACASPATEIGRLPHSFGDTHLILRLKGRVEKSHNPPEITEPDTTPPEGKGKPFRLGLVGKNWDEEKSAEKDTPQKRRKNTSPSSRIGAAGGGFGSRR